MQAAYEHCETLVRERDRDRFLSFLYAPAAIRRHLFAIAAFDLEIERVPDAVRDPMAGEIRLQWWREAVSGERKEEADANPVAAALLDTLQRCELPKAVLIAAIDSRQFNLLGEPMESRDALRKALDATVGTPLRLSIQVLDPGWHSPQVLHDAALALGLTRILRNLSRDIAKGRLYLPLDLLAAHDVHTASVFAGDTSPGLKSALTELSVEAMAALSRFHANEHSQRVLPAFLPLALVPSLLGLIEKTRDPFRERMELSGLKSQFLVWCAARRGRA